MKTSIQAASMFLWLQLDWMSQGGNVEQHPSTLSVQEGDSSVINCTYSDSFSDYFPWYKQEPGQGLQLIIDIRSNLEKKQDQRLTVSLNKAAKHVSLHIAATQPGDSAIYFCVASGRTSGSYKYTFGTGTILKVLTNITDPQPAVYQLRSSDSKSSKLSMCLLTDFDSQTNVSQRTESETVFTSHTVLNMKSLDSKSYGALAWSQNSRLSCQDAFSNHTFLSSSDASCDAKLVEKSFETDMNLNFQNLSVIGLRLLLLKVAGFNLLMTLRLWSS